MGDFDFGQWGGNEPRNSYTNALKRQGFEPPTDGSPFPVPSGWHGGQVDQTGGMVMVRRWYTCPGPGLGTGSRKCGDVEYEMAYGSDPHVSIQRYRWNGDYYAYDGEVETVDVGANTDEAKARAAKRLMQKHSSKAR
jgi:hypothetical protein